MNLFDASAIDETRLGPKDHNEPSYFYLQTSGKRSAALVRELLEKWFQDYPEEHQNELRQRFVTSKTDIDSPVFELALHAIFKHLGAKVEIHPKVSDETDKRPDFLIRLGNGFEFYLEAVLARGQSDEERNRESVVNSLYAIIDRKLLSPEYFWSVTVLERGLYAPSGKRVVSALARYMTELCRDSVHDSLMEHGFDTPMKFVWKDAGWCIEFIPIPKNIDAIGKPNHRPIGSMLMSEAVICNDREDIREAINFKLKHHSTLEKPYVIAVNAVNWSTDWDDFIEGIYGSEQIMVGYSIDGKPISEFTRAMDGIWLRNEGTKNERLIAVLGALRLHAWGVGSAKLTIYENPYIDFPSEARLEGLQRMEPKEGSLASIKGKTLGELFGLAEAWPDLDE